MSLWLKLAVPVIGTFAAIVVVLADAAQHDKDPSKKWFQKVTWLKWLACALLLCAAIFGAVTSVLDHRHQAQADNLLAQERLQSRADRAQSRADRRDLQAALRANNELLRTAAPALASIAADANDRSSSAIAAAALDGLFNFKRRAFVKIEAVMEGQELREKSGFFINDTGDVMTTDFAIVDPGSGKAPSSDIRVRSVDGRQRRATVKHLDTERGIAVLATGLRDTAFLQLADRVPRVGEQVLVVGFKPGEDLTRAAGRISEVGEGTGHYVRDEDLLPGFGGGPIVAHDGVVVGINWGALEPPKPGTARFIRADRVAATLAAEGGLPPESGLSSRRHG